MKAYASFVVLAAATVVSAQQPVFNQTSGLYVCPIANGTYCAGDSLSTNIIIRCTGTVGQPGNCNDNLDGEFPFGLNYSPCYAPSEGVAACSKNCVVYGGSGNIPGTFTLPNCTPYATSTTSSVPSTSTAAPTNTTSGAEVVSTTTVVTSVFTTVCPSPTTLTYGSSTYTVTAPTTLTITSCDCTISSTPPAVPLSTASASATSAPPSGISNSTATLSTTTGSGTATPVGPTTSPAPTLFTGGANTNAAGVVVAAIGVMVAYLL